MLVKEVALGIFFDGDCGETGRIFSPVSVLRDVRNHGDCGRSLIDELVGERYAHCTGSDVARCAACWSALWQSCWG
jgi:hypothetical protein